MKRFLTLLLFIPLALAAQDKGIHFQHGMTWKDIQAKAKAENKYVFVDGFTTWCGPCKYMAANVFPDENAGIFFNKNFINVKAQLDTTATDNPEINKWYADAHNLMYSYNITVFPTYLFFDPNGKLVHRFVGSTTVKDFISKAGSALDPKTQYYPLLDRYKSGNADAETLKSVAVAAMNAYDIETGKEAFNKYAASQKDVLTKENEELIDMFTTGSSDKAFALIVANPAKYDELKGKKNAANDKIVNILVQEQMGSLFKGNTTPDFSRIQSDLSSRYPAYAKQATAKLKVSYYQAKQDWKNFGSAAVDFMDTYHTSMAPEEVNALCWTLFEHETDARMLNKAIEWSHSSFADNNNPAFMDTYANLLYKAGRKQDAIKWEEKALKIAPKEEQSSYTEALAKMKKGEKTW
jgi:thioredoxin-related protein/tetratricopeptide (TPR) repeat protein